MSTRTGTSAIRTRRPKAVAQGLGAWDANPRVNLFYESTRVHPALARPKSCLVLAQFDTAPLPHVKSERLFQRLVGRLAG